MKKEYSKTDKICIAIFYFINLFNFLFIYRLIDIYGLDVSNILIFSYGLFMGTIFFVFLIIGTASYVIIFTNFAYAMFYPDKTLKEIELDNLRKNFEKDRSNLFKQYKLNRRKIRHKQ